jgi:hypothetical protein
MNKPTERHLTHPYRKWFAKLQKEKGIIAVDFIEAAIDEKILRDGLEPVKK